MALLGASAAVIHTLIGAALFGAMVYSLGVVQPRAQAYFERQEQFEEFVATVSRGARWKVVLAFAALWLTGCLLALPLRASLSWKLLLAVKVAAFVAACGLFAYVSWRLWPARILASADEIPEIQRAFRFVGASLLLLVAACIAIGVLMRWTV
jgi:hypothetical protein